MAIAQPRTIEQQIDPYLKLAYLLDAVAGALTPLNPLFFIPLMLILWRARRSPLVCDGLLSLLHLNTITPLVLVALPGAAQLIGDPGEQGAAVAPGTLVVPQLAAPQQIVPQLPARWYPQVQDAPEQVPHLLVLGPTGSGKSALMEALARARTDQLLIIQPNRKHGEWAGLPVVQCDDDGGYEAIRQALQRVMAEFTARGGAMRYGDPGPWLTIVWDEIPLCIDELKEEARRVVRRLLSAGRPRKMRLIGGSTSDRVGAFGLDGFGDLLDGAALLRLGAFAVSLLPGLAETEHPTVLELHGAVTPVVRGPVLQLMRLPVAPARCWSAPAPNMAQDDLLAAFLGTGSQPPAGADSGRSGGMGTGSAEEVPGVPPPPNAVPGSSQAGTLGTPGTLDPIAEIRRMLQSTNPITNKPYTQDQIIALIGRRRQDALAMIRQAKDGLEAK